MLSTAATPMTTTSAGSSPRRGRPDRRLSELPALGNLTNPADPARHNVRKTGGPVSGPSDVSDCSAVTSERSEGPSPVLRTLAMCRLFP
jgi:hypothetical protein